MGSNDDFSDEANCEKVVALDTAKGRRSSSSPCTGGAGTRRLEWSDWRSRVNYRSVILAKALR
jgi:hypothetical protein